MERQNQDRTRHENEFADFTVNDRNPVTIPLGEIDQTNVLAPSIAGEKSFSAREGETK